MVQTNLLPPVTAVRIVWALTGEFSDDEHSKINAKLVEDNLKTIKDLAEQQKDKDGKIAETEETIYVRQAIALIDACVRNLDIIHKKRQLDFQENNELRQAYLDTITENLEFGTKAKDIVKSLPTMGITSVGGITLIESIKGSGIQLNSLQMWGIGGGLAAVGYIINLLIVRATRRYKQKLFVSQDYERGLYFGQYITRVKTSLISLYLDMNRIHKNIFGQPYPVEKDDVEGIVGEMLKGVQPMFCPYVHKHIQEKKVTPELWPLCETGKSSAVEPGKPSAVEQCIYWEGKK
jgi:hypothetical protein